MIPKHQNGAWTISTFSPGYYGSDYLHDGNTGKETKALLSRLIAIGGHLSGVLRAGQPMLIAQRMCRSI